jgi:hypothetical protein
MPTGRESHPCSSPDSAAATFLYLRTFVTEVKLHPCLVDLTFEGVFVAVDTLSSRRNGEKADGSLASPQDGPHIHSPGLRIRAEMRSQFGRSADFGLGGNAAFIFVPRMRSSAMLSALSSLASGGT